MHKTKRTELIVLVKETRHVLYMNSFSTISFSIISHSLDLNGVSFGRNSAVKDILELPNVPHAHTLER